MSVENPSARRQSEHMRRVAEFMRLAEQPGPAKPTEPDGHTAILRVRLILEELLEFANAVGVRLGLVGEDDDTGPLKFSDFTFDPTLPCDLVKAADGLADLSVVVVGSMVALGIKDEALLEEVDRNNLSKFGPGGRKDPNSGKWLKPPNHQPPDIAAVLQAQGWCSSSAEGGANANACDKTLQLPS